MNLRRFFSRRSRDEEMAREMEAHLAMEADWNLARGLSPEEAQRRAYVEFGSPRRVRESEWESNSLMAIEGVWRDVKYAVRTLARTPGFTMAAVLVMALGIGANAALFTVVRTVVLAAEVGLTVVLAAVALMGCALPAWRASRLDPLRVLRTE
jgi:hypothetical protein